MKRWLVTAVQAWREDWRATKQGTKVVVLVLAAVCLASAAFALWFSMTFDTSEMATHFDEAVRGQGNRGHPTIGLMILGAKASVPCDDGQPLLQRGQLDQRSLR